MSLCKELLIMVTRYVDNEGVPTVPYFRMTISGLKIFFLDIKTFSWQVTEHKNLIFIRSDDLQEVHAKISFHILKYAKLPIFVILYYLDQDQILSTTY